MPDTGTNAQDRAVPGRKPLLFLILALVLSTLTSDSFHQGAALHIFNFHDSVGYSLAC